METLTLPDSILPVRSRRHQSDKFPRNRSERLFVSLCQSQSYYPSFLAYLFGLFSDKQLKDVLLALCQGCWMWPLIGIWSDKVDCDDRPPVRRDVVPLCILFIMAGAVVSRGKTSRTAPLASLPALPLPLGWPSALLHPQLPALSISAFKHKIGVWMEKALQWLVATVVTLRHTHHSSGQSFCRLLHNPQCSPSKCSKNVSLDGFFKRLCDLSGFKSWTCCLFFCFVLVFFKKAISDNFWRADAQVQIFKNNSRELNMEVFILMVYLACDRRPGSCQPC